MLNGETKGTQREVSCLAGAIGRVTSILAIPYGYTVTLGAAALLSVARLGAPSEIEVLFFVGGAVLGFVCLAAIGRPHLADEIPMRVPWLVVFNLFPFNDGQHVGDHFSWATTVFEIDAELYSHCLPFVGQGTAQAGLLGLFSAPPDRAGENMTSWWPL